MQKPVAVVDVYQLKEDRARRLHRRSTMEHLAKRGLPVSRSNYDLVFTFPYCKGDSPQAVFEKFNADPPAEYSGRRLIVSDVLVIHHDGIQQAFYIDKGLCVEVAEFLLVP